ncbi:MAG: DUF1003 domain-containing protein [Eubacteriales bacterium]|nr:DUF1003 domain-containing protein [Eubacteriales bacterium]
MAGKNRSKLIKELLKNTEEQFDDEELMRLLIEQKVTVNSNEENEQRTFGQKAADAVARFAGSWAFIFSFLLVMLVWIVLNILLATHAFDAYPFILLNLLLSCIAAIQAPLIMMSQNRQEAKDRARAENDYRVNLKNELVIDDLHKKLDTVAENQRRILRLLEEEKAGGQAPEDTP